jgi:hypothetical protein
MAEMILRPLRITRAANVAPGIAVIAVGVVRGALASHAGVRAAVVAVVVVGAWLAVRGYRIAVVVDSRSVTVRGLLWSRRVPRDAVLEVTRLAGLRWRDGRGRRRWTPLVMFMESSGRLKTSRRVNQTSLRELSAALNVAGPGLPLRGSPG